MNPLLFLLFLAGVGAGIVGTIIFFAMRRPATPPGPPTEEQLPEVTLIVTPEHYCAGNPVRVHWMTNGASTTVRANRDIRGFPRAEQSADATVTIEGPPDAASFDTEFTVISRNNSGQSTIRRETATGHRGPYIISRSGEARCNIEQIFGDQGDHFRHDNARTFIAILDVATFGDMRASEVEIFPYPTPPYRYPVPTPYRFSVYHDNELVIPIGQQIAPYTGLVRGEWKVTTERLRISGPTEPDEPCYPDNAGLFAQLVVGIKIRAVCA